MHVSLRLTLPLNQSPYKNSPWLADGSSFKPSVSGKPVSTRFSKATSGKCTEAAHSTHGSESSVQRPSKLCAGVSAESQPLSQ